MPNLASVLKQEILRLARKETRSAIKDIQQTLRLERQQVRELRTELKVQGKELLSLRKALEAKAVALPASKGSTSTRVSAKATGWRKDSVRTTRSKHGLSQQAMAKLLGVGLNTVWLWEKGRNNPRTKQQMAILDLRELSPVQLANRLTAVGLGEARKKPGRRKGSGKAGAGAKATAVGKKSAKKSAKKPSKGGKTARKATSVKKVSRKKVVRKKSGR
jgi:DNA-binding transcriptional regulator YiaG